MEIGNNGIKFHSWQVLLFAIIVIFAIGSMTVVAINGQKVEVEKINAEQKERTERGHWLWGHWHDIAEKKK